MTLGLASLNTPGRFSKWRFSGITWPWWVERLDVKHQCYEKGIDVKVGTDWYRLRRNQLQGHHQAVTEHYINMIHGSQDEGHWVTVWAAMPQWTVDYSMPPKPFTGADRTFHNSTIRQTLRVTIGGEHMRVRLSNVFGLTDLCVTKATIALPALASETANGGSVEKRVLTGSKTVVAESIQPLTFCDETSVTVSKGAQAVSDPVEFAVGPGQVITLSIFLQDGQSGAQVTTHPISRTRSWFCHGDYTEVADMDGPDCCHNFSWYFLSGVETWQEKQCGTMVLVGDSLTDSVGSTLDGNDNWPDLLFDRMMDQSSGQHVASINQASAGSRVLQDDAGPNLMSRLDRDVFAQPGVRYMMVFYGVNDIGMAEPDVETQRQVGEQLIQAYKQIVSRAHALGIAVFGSPITPFMAPEGGESYYAHLNREVTRQTVNSWIRRSGVFDALVDFDELLRDPGNPSVLAPDFSLDYLHVKGPAFRAMADAFPLHLFETFCKGHDGFR